jgi:hypothetical protein
LSGIAFSSFGSNQLNPLIHAAEQGRDAALMPVVPAMKVTLLAYTGRQALFFGRQ